MAGHPLEAHIRDIPDFPEPGVVFKDITPLLGHPDAFDQAISEMVEPFLDLAITKIVGIEARGFIFGAPIADRLGAGFVPVRKPGKLPWDVRSQEYVLEYGTDTLEVHSDAVGTSDRILIVDDVLATGGTARATIDLFTEFGAKVEGLAVLMELVFLGGRSKLTDINVHAVVHHDIT